ncbi:HepA Superfamily II DNA RNA helicase SNF2 family [Pyrenophora tritici-repentis]|nr:Chromodomain-helicase-DNA-binding protein 4 [Pyrenophora tritici-repentis]KAI0608784.1 Chromodomain-helicase-DNA-binding protein 4 [Pyrenophora tritici-repentis]KAI1538214.1 HepA Superfamily II DNA RNA helicase SNF2 family [Pyrenophora tritici-repentis]KAI1543561.1 HepA Superfamily II DNA RNA helicase SNF2 family [Pyrenophora tritici-repentis]KAI1555899.1 HepA Superfamily II DNA RNA helicase SNF2 family [Pyrenophora tritici-repentis]
MSNDEDGAALMTAFKKRGTARALSKESSFSPRARFTAISSDGDDNAMSINTLPQKKRALYVRVSPKKINTSEYKYYEPVDEVETILREFAGHELLYQVRLFGGRIKQVDFEELLELPGGPEALQVYQPDDDPNDTPSNDDNDMKLRNRASKAKNNGFVDTSTIPISSSEDKDQDELESDSQRRRPGPQRTMKRRRGRPSMARSQNSDRVALYTGDEDSEDQGGSRRRRKRKGAQEPTHQSSASDILHSDIMPGRKRKRRTTRTAKPEKVPRAGTRQSDRAIRATNNMQEADMNDIYRSDSTPKVAAQKVSVVREVFPKLPRSDPFRARHAEGCEVCFDGPNVAPLVYCQGCSLAYHKNCLGNRSNRDHLVIKVGDENFVLQCKRCIGFYKKKDATAPDLSRCQDCFVSGASCRPFRRRKTTQQEMKEREENDGHDPVVDVPSELVNNPSNVLFRCTKCSRAWHYHHLPPLSQYAMDINRDDDEMADDRFREYSGKWLCKECDETSNKKVGGIIAWRPSDVETYRPGTPCELVCEDDKQYLIKWENESYFRAAWHSGAWTWGVTASVQRKAFFKREDGPKMRTEDAIPEEYLRIDIVLDIKYTSYVEVRSEEIDKARIKEVDKALIKYKGLGYEDTVWESVPTPEDGERWLDFVTAYNDWVAGRYVKIPKQGPLKGRLEKARSMPFAKLEREKQPDNLVGGELMKYQLEGLNWLYYKWYEQKNAILADEMGLGKTIQVIAFMATLIQEHNCFPFLIVVPNSTCANWRREIKQWAPSLRVVAYFGSAKAREMAYQYEMFPEKTKDLRCHVVVTSYDAAADDNCRKFFKSVSWAGLVVDEGQRLKNDKSQLYTALTAVRAPFRLLLTGTPLQNNARELFNLLHFLDDTINAAELEEQYAEMTAENIRELHNQIRPFILRRTKAKVLTFLPPLGQIILPISMSHLQKQVYKSILSKSPELLKALFTSDKQLKQQERANLSNILMQLRKCLCHPFVYSREIEERSDVAAVSHRNLVEASAKLSLLEMLLPKLHERGHRVLIFSQFLDMLNIIEDFLDGMQLPYQRLDGTMGSLEKQKRIDQFNAPDSPLFAFLLSTRAGGVGINLATADTVIILDPDWNPHQDLQAIARAHRIGQKNKVLCLQLATRASVEEKIMQMGKKKMALDKVVVQDLDREDPEDEDVESILKYGAAELFKDDDADHDIRYDDASIDKLLDRSQIENTKTGDDDSAESQFGFARIWVNEKGTLQDDFDTVDEEIAPDPGVWDKILKERQAAAAAEALARAEAMGRGRRAKAAVDYATEKKDAETASTVGDDDHFEDTLTAPPSPGKKNKKRKVRASSESDTDFQADSEDESEPEQVFDDIDAAKELGHERRRSTTNNANSSLYKQNGAGASQIPPFQMSKFHAVTFSMDSPATKHRPVKSFVVPPRGGFKSTSGPSQQLSSVEEITAPATTHTRASRDASSGSVEWISSNQAPAAKAVKANGTTVKPFERAHIPIRNPLEPAYRAHSNHICPACHKDHPQGACELKAAGVEHCGLCGLAHYGHSRTCPHIKSETQVREMLEALKNSPEKKELVDAAMKYLRGVKGTLVQQKKKDREKAALAKGQPLPAPPYSGVGRPPKNAYVRPPPGPMNGIFAGPQPGGTCSNGLPNYGVPSAHHGPANAQPGSSGTQGQRTFVNNNQMVQQMAQQMHGQGYDDQHVGSALRGFLGGN